MNHYLYKLLTPYGEVSFINPSKELIEDYCIALDMPYNENNQFNKLKLSKFYRDNI